MVERLLIFTVVLTLTSGGGSFAASASPSTPPSAEAVGPGPSAPPDGPREGRHDKDPREGDEERKFHGKFKERLEKMSPEERKHFEENWKRWKEMGDRERKEWQRRTAEARERMEKAVDETLQKLELTLDADRREVFALRYRQERKKIEEELCREMGERRQEMIEQMQQRLKSEFTGGGQPAPIAPAAPGN